MVFVANVDGFPPPLTIFTPVQLDDKVVNGLTLSTDLPQVDSGASECSTADVVSILLLLGLQSIKMRLNGQGNNSRRVVGQVLL